MGNEYWAIIASKSNSLSHFGVLGMKWGVRRYQNPDGTLTDRGKRRYVDLDGKITKKGKRELTSEQRKKAISDFNEQKKIDDQKNTVHALFGNASKKRNRIMLDAYTSSKTKAAINDFTRSVKAFNAKVKSMKDANDDEIYKVYQSIVGNKKETAMASVAKDIGVDPSYEDFIYEYLQRFID